MKIRPPGREGVEQQAGGCTKGAARSRRTGSKAGLVWFDWFGGLVWLVERKTLLVRFEKKKKRIDRQTNN
jgi:hypothetical protein